MNSNTRIALSFLGAMISVAGLLLLIVRLALLHAMPIGLPSAFAAAGMVICLVSSRRAAG
jgi:hypothetical protein